MGGSLENRPFLKIRNGFREILFFSVSGCCFCVWLPIGRRGFSFVSFGCGVFVMIQVSMFYVSRDFFNRKNIKVGMCTPYHSVPDHWDRWKSREIIIAPLAKQFGDGLPASGEYTRPLANGDTFVFDHHPYSVEISARYGMELYGAFECASDSPLNTDLIPDGDFF